MSVTAELAPAPGLAVRRVADRSVTEQRPLRIAMVGLRGIPATYGGVERAVEELSATLAGNGHEVTVFARRSYCDAPTTRHRGVEVVHLGQINTKHLEAISHTAWAVAAALRSRRFDVVHFHATGPSLLSFVPRLIGVPTVATVQGLDWRREKWGPIARLVLRMAARASAVFPSQTIVVSRELERHFQECFDTDPVYIPNGVERPTTDTIPIDGLEADRFVLFLGRLVPEKHVHTLIESYRHVETDLPLVIAGPSSHSPDYVERLERLAARDPRVQLVGPRYGGEKAWLMSNALAFVQPSSIEGLPIALLEALEAGRFPIVSDIPENLEAVTVGDERIGLQVPVGDLEALAAAIQHAIGRSDRGPVDQRLCDQVRRAYDWNRIAEATELVYREAIAPRWPLVAAPHEPGQPILVGAHDALIADRAAAAHRAPRRNGDTPNRFRQLHRGVSSRRGTVLKRRVPRRVRPLLQPRRCPGSISSAANPLRRRS
jgi:glycosyltransferase involved in cell wall biosynthesis